MQKKCTHTIYISSPLEQLINDYREQHKKPDGKPMSLSYFLQLSAYHLLNSKDSIVTTHLPGE